MQKIIEIQNGIARMPEWRMKEPVNIEIAAGEHIAIIGENGSGKSMLVDIITQRHPLLGDWPVYDFSPSSNCSVSENIKYISFKDSYGDNTNYFLQLRWNQQEIDNTIPTVRSLLDNACNALKSNTANETKKKHILDLFDLNKLLDKRIILLSSGELRKFQIAKALFCNPRVLIIDNPFIGLDAETRNQLTILLKALASENQLQIIITVSKTDDIPEFITHVIEVKDRIVKSKVTRKCFLDAYCFISLDSFDTERETAILNLPYKENPHMQPEIIRLKNVYIKYGDKTILSNLNWTVMNGERWALSGKNGTGKSTLLSLICADNPQSYACNISLFGNRRGSGESIWDIKKHIGYVSPEMHRAYRQNLPAIRIVASGLSDSIGLYVKPKDGDYKICKWWMHIFGIEQFADTPFMKLSSGEQRLVLLARAFVKDPDLLILDEPFHGLDDKNSSLVKGIIETFCKRKNKTLIMVTHYTDELPPCIDRHITLKGNTTKK